MILARNNAEFATWTLSNWPRVCVPSMGALHEGHLHLVHRATQYCLDRGWAPSVVVTVFVNPTQFNDPADFHRYPKTLEEDCAKCEAAGAACVFAPAAADIYPHGPSTFRGTLPSVATEPGLEDRLRPGHFAGVYQVVERLFRLVQPAAAIFGEKDWQQLQVIRALVSDLGLPTEVVGVPTVREPDGLAMSSRNRFLSPDDRKRGLSLIRALRAAATEPSPTHAEAAMAAELAKDGLVPEYAVVRQAKSLQEPDPLRPAACRALIAARVGTVRLLDNAPWPESV